MSRLVGWSGPLTSLVDIPRLAWHHQSGTGSIVMIQPKQYHEPAEDANPHGTSSHEGNVIVAVPAPRASRCGDSWDPALAAPMGTA